ncbi:hypothetical protein ACTXGQ_07135 [Marinobacter sp. 1Y8]
MTRPTSELIAISRGSAARRFSGAFLPRLSFQNPARIPPILTTRLAAIVLAVLSFTACGLKPTSPMYLESPVQQLPQGVSAFSTQVTPVAGRTPLLREVEKEVVSRMTARGYHQDAAGNALTIGIQLQTTGSIRPRSGIVESGHLVFEMRDSSGHLLRRGRSLHLNANDLDFMNQAAIAKRVSVFLEGIPALTP